MAKVNLGKAVFVLLNHQNASLQFLDKATGKVTPSDFKTVFIKVSREFVDGMGIVTLLYSRVD